MDIIERFKKYIAFNTKSDEESTSVPSSASQIEFGKMLVEDLKELGVEDIEHSKSGYIYAFVDNKKSKSIALIAHMDTSPDLDGGLKNPKIIENYDGKEIVLNDKYKLAPSYFPCLNEVIGEDLLVSDGDHLVGGDDKAGIVIIFEFLKYYIAHKDEFNYNLAICFTIDEEIGCGTDHIDVKKIKADVAYTLDGGSIYEANFENFNASSAVVEVKGLGVHPGDAKDVMVNAGLIAAYYASLLPLSKTPFMTEKYEGFIHLSSIKGNVEYAKMEFIIRDHDYSLLQEKENLMLKTRDLVLKTFPKADILINIKEEYRNMNTYFLNDSTPIRMVNSAYMNTKTKLKYTPIRGGTDGARITYMGLPCPNLGNGDYNPHGRFEFVSLTQMKLMVDILKELYKGDIL